MSGASPVRSGARSGEPVAEGCETEGVARSDGEVSGDAWAPPRAEPTAGPGAPGAAPSSPDDRSFGQRVQSVIDRAGAGGPDGVTVPFESFGEAASWWFRPLVDSTTWRSFASILAIAVVAPFLFAFTVAIAAVTSALMFVLVGFLLVVPAFAAVGAFSTVGRRLAGWGIDEPISPRPFAPSRTGGLIGPIASRLTDETRWRQLGYVVLDVVVAPLFLVAAFTPLSLLAGSFGSVNIENSATGIAQLIDVGIDLSLFGTLLIVLLLPLAGRLLQLAGRLRHRYTAALVGPDREQVLVERVEELSVQRDQVLDAVAAERRRIERNLHDGVQQQLVALGIDIGRASRKLDDDPETARELLDDARDKVRASIGELRLIGRGLHPAVLGDRGLDAALSAVVANAPIPIDIDVSPVLGTDGRAVELPAEIEETAYYLASESIANALKYANARAASIRVGPEPGLLPAVRITVHDDGRGGADESQGTGIAGMRARVEAVDGAFALSSPTGGPTSVTAVIPIRRRRLGGDGADGGTEAPAATEEGRS